MKAIIEALEQRGIYPDGCEIVSLIRCPEAIPTRDNEYDICGLTRDKPCTKGELPCEYFNDYLKEIEDEATQ